MNTINRSSVLRWFSGAALKKATVALDNLEASEARGSWLPGVSRSVRAALKKANEAAKIGKRHRAALQGIGGYDVPRHKRGWAVESLLTYGAAHNDYIDFAAIRAGAPTTGLKLVVDQAETFFNDLRPVRELMDRLDATRPEPVFTYLGVSPTVTSLLESLGLAVNAASVRVCPMVWEKVEKTDAKGNVFYETIGRLEWPAGTVHGASRYASDPFTQCHACGHAIKNSYNWVPLILTNEAGVPHSLWTGIDCARNLFGIKVTGVLEIAR